MTESPDQNGQGPKAPKADVGVGAPRSKLSDRVAEAPSVSLDDAVSRATLIRIGILTILLIALHYKLLKALMLSWRDPNWTHGYIIPLFSAYLLYSRRHELYEAIRKGREAGKASVLSAVLGLALMALAMWAEWEAVFRIRNHFIAQVAMVWMLFGLVLFVGGWSIIRLTWLPVLFLLFAIPIPTIIYERFSLPLQNLSAKGSVVIMRLLGVDIQSTASNLQFLSVTKKVQNLTVAEACSGMRLLMAFVALGWAMAYLDQKPIWQRAILVVAAIPIAVFCNVLRVTITCWMFYIDRSELGQKFMHTFTGILMLIPAFLMLWALGWVIRSIFVDADEDETESVEEATA